MRYILHYTEPGDVVFDAFCGSGMSGIAAQMCGDRKAVESLGYSVDDNGTISDGSVPISRLGMRQSVLVDLSPAATFIAYNYSAPADVAAFEREAKRILRDVKAECGWMYDTWHPRCDHPQRVKGLISFTVWSEVFVCPQCHGEITFLDEALDPETKAVRETLSCPHCAAQLTKRSMEKYRTSVFDPILGRTVEVLKRRPALIQYTVGRKKYSKRPDSHDLEVLDRVERLPLPTSIPSNPFPIWEMYHGSRLAPKGVTHVHHLFLPRPARALEQSRCGRRREVEGIRGLCG